jgi:hypothetical protein
MRLRDAQFDFRRPGYGIGPDSYENFLDWTLRGDFPSGHQLALAELQPPQ